MLLIRGAVVADRGKCLHDPSKLATEKYRMQSQSHELFALGLTTDSLTANEDEHKQVMEETIAAFDDKLVKAQKAPSGQNNVANNDEGIKGAAVAPISPPDISLLKGPTSQQQYPVEVHQIEARQTIPTTFEQGMGKFKLNDARKQKLSRKGSKPTTDTAFGMKRVDARKASGIPQPIVLQQPKGSVVSPTAAKQPYNKNLTTWRPTLQENVTSCSAATPNNFQTGCKAFQKSFNPHLEAPDVISLKARTEPLWLSRSSNNSERDTHTMATDESMLSLDRSPSPFSEPSSSKPPSFVHLSDLERSKSHNRVLESQIALRSECVAHEQTPAVAYNGMDLDDNSIPSSFEELLNANWDDDTMFSKSTATDYPTGFISLDSKAKPALIDAICADMADPMEVDI